jgi:pimeloyl-ACP methyl ester carboxylesterase
MQGSGPALLIIHGWINGASNWGPAVKYLSDHFTCYTWNARMHLGEVPVSMERLARDVKQIIDTCELKNVMLMGHSMGALTLWQYLRDFGSEGIAAAVIIDQSPRLLTDDAWSLGLYGHYTAEMNEQFEARLEADFVTHAMELGLSAYRLTEEQKALTRTTELFKATRAGLATFAPRPWIEAWKSLVRSDYRELLPGLELPLFLAYGKECAFYGEQVAHFTRQAIPGAVMKLYSPATHYPHLESPQLFLEDLLQFCRDRVAICGESFGLEGGDSC